MATLSQVQRLLPSSKYGTLYAIDLETIGTDASSPEAGVVGVGFANEDGCFYIDLRGMEVAALEYLIDFLTKVKLTAFNVLFDGAFLAALTGRWLDWVGCSFALFKQLSSEGFDGQSWSLESAQLDILGWPYTNKDEIQQVLKERGLTKAEMGTLEPEVLGPYCASDADAAWQLWEQLNSVIEANNFRYLRAYHQREFMSEVELLVEAQFRGIKVNLDGLKSYHRDLSNRIENSLQSFLNLPSVATHIGEYNKEVVAAIEAAAPPRLTQKGEVNKNWIKWDAGKEARIEAGKFNPNSAKQLNWLFYKKLFKVVRDRAKDVVIEVDGKQYEVEKTPGGQTSVKKQILPLFGEPGRALMHYNKLRKELSYVAAAIQRTEEGGGVLRPMYNSIGTLTGRLSGGEADDD